MRVRNTFQSHLPDDARSSGRRRARYSITLVAALVVFAVIGWAESRTITYADDVKPHAPMARTPNQQATHVIRVARFVYAQHVASRCFSDHFLTQANEKTAIATSGRFHTVRLSSDQRFDHPMAVMTGEGEFELTDAERAALRSYLERGGFLLASAGCSSEEWDQSFRDELAHCLPEYELRPISMDHAVFHTVYDIDAITTRKGQPAPLEAIAIDGRVAVLYSRDGLNDTNHAENCCCCGGNEVINAMEINLNALAYALLY